MQPIDDDLLMAYADGELDAARCAEVEALLAAQPTLAERVRRQRALRERLTAAFAPALDEPVPQRLLHAVGAKPAATLSAEAKPPAEMTAGAVPAATVVDLAAQRARRAAGRPAANAPAAWWRWGGVAASLALGTLLGLALAPRLRDDADVSRAVATAAGGLLARGELARTLNEQPAGVDRAGGAGGAGEAGAAGAPGAIHVALSFVDRTGRYCRAFSVSGSAGLACRDGADWSLQMLAPQSAATGGDLRQAATPLPAAVLQAIDARISGSTLDAADERAALRSGWRR